MPCIGWSDYDLLQWARENIDSVTVRSPSARISRGTDTGFQIIGKNHNGDTRETGAIGCPGPYVAPPVEIIPEVSDTPQLIDDTIADVKKYLTPGRIIATIVIAIIISMLKK